MRKLLFLLFFIFIPKANASVTINGQCYNLVWNPWTGNNQYVNCNSSTSLAAGSTNYWNCPTTGTFTSIYGIDVASGIFKNYIDLTAPSIAPGAPLAGTARLYTQTNHGFTQFVQDNETPTNTVLGSDNTVLVRNTSGGILNPGQVVRTNGSTGNVPNVELAIATTTISPVSAVAVVVDTISINGYGLVMTIGVLNKINTSEFSAGDELYLSTTTRGGVQNFRPVVPYSVQRVGEVLVSGIGNGSVYVFVSRYVGGRESGTMRTFNASAGILASTETVTYNINAGSETVNGWEDFVSQSLNPPSPTAGTARFHSASTQGFTRFEQDNEASTNLILGRDNVFIAKNTSGVNFIAGQTVYVTGATGNVPNVGLAIASSTVNKIPAVGITLDPINDNNFGQIMINGIISNINTSAFSVGDSIYLSTITLGGLINARPLTPDYVQRIGSVLVSGVGNGSLLVSVAPFIGGKETGTNQPYVFASTVTFTGSSAPVNSKALCLSGGQIGHCTTAVDASGGCTCSAP